MGTNFVQIGDEVVVDLTTDTVTPDKLALGVTAHDKSGNKITGTTSIYGNIEDSNLVLNGDMPDGTYPVQLKLEDGSWLEIGVVGKYTNIRLPAEYQEVEWVQIVNEETGDIHSGIHTNIPWKNATKIIAKVQNVTSGNTNDMLFSSWLSMTEKQAPYISTQSGRANYLFGVSSGFTTFALNPNNIPIANTDVNTFTFTFASTSANYIFFGCWRDNTYSHPHRWYSVEIYNGSTLIAHFVPCYRKSDILNGFYDLVGGVFYKNAYTGETFMYRGNEVFGEAYLNLYSGSEVSYSLRGTAL